MSIVRNLFRLTFLFLLTPLLVSADVVNVDVQGGGAPRDSVGLAAHPDAAGATAIWNLFSNTGGSALLDSTGVATTVGFSISTSAGGAIGSWRQQNTTGPQLPLLYDYVFDNSPIGADRELTLAITGLDAAATYDLYVYGGTQFTDDRDSTIDYTLSGNTNTIAWTGLDGNANITTQYFLGENYTVFSGLTGSTALSVLATPQDLGGGVFGEPTISGFALVAVPEPGSVSLVACMLGMFAARRRRRV